MIYSYKGQTYPSYIKTGNAVNHIEILAKQFCKGKGLDIGGFLEWTLPGAIPINIKDNLLEFDAMNLPGEKVDYIFSSHCLEHLENPIDALEYWKSKLKDHGVVFLYLPHPEMEYWLPQNNKKHLHSWYPYDMQKIFTDLGFNDVLFSERDLYWSFSVVGFKR